MNHLPAPRTALLTAAIATALALSGCSSDDDASVDELSATLAMTDYSAAEALNPILADHLPDLRFVDVDGHRLAYTDRGPADAPAVLFVHGIPTSSLLFREVGRGVADAGYRFVAVDLLGFGSSEKPDEADLYTVEAHAARTYAFADAIGLDGFTLGMHDIGGAVGGAMLLGDIERLDAIVAANTFVGLDGVMPGEFTVPILAQERTAEEVWSRLDDPDFATLSTRSFLAQGFAPGTTPSEALVTAYAAPLDDGASRAFVTFFEDLPNFLATESARRAAMADFDGPTAVLFGAEDGFFAPTIVAPDLQAAFGTPDENLTLIPDSGHYAQEQTPEAWTAAVIDFLDRELGN